MIRITCSVILMLALFAGCQHMPPEPAEPVRVPDVEEPAYEPFRPESPPPMPSLDSLAGRTICIDPGHGGRWPGAVAPSNQLRESDINLRVALRLRDVLEDAGARVVLTRTDDSPLHPDLLSEDLSARAAIANREEADVFISIHHNAYIDPTVEMNDLEVYYQLADSGPSLDVAQSLTYGLARWFRQDAENKRLLPGNYRVLREAEVPAVLTEAGYLTHGPMAFYLMTDHAVDAQANALAAGLAHYFDLDPPRVRDITLLDTSRSDLQAMRIRFSLGVPINPHSVRVRVNGESVPGLAKMANNSIIWTFDEPLPNGDLEIDVFARNGEGASVAVPAFITIDRPVETLLVRQIPELAPVDPDIELLYEIHALDALGKPVADGTEIEVTGREKPLSTRDGRAAFYRFARDIRGPVMFNSGGAEATISPQFGGEEMATLRCLDALTARPIGGVIAMADDQPVATSTPEGWLVIPTEHARVELNRFGYESLGVNLARTHNLVEMRPKLDGVLHGRRIVLDAAHGGREPGRIGPTGGRASDINLDVVQQLAARLRDAGASVFLTREDDSDLSPMQRLIRAESHNPDILVSVSYGIDIQESRLLGGGGVLRRTSDPGFAAHHPGSQLGIRLGSSISGELHGRVAVVPSAAYLIQQTSCPAVLVHPAPIDGSYVERNYRDASRRRQDADGIYRGIVRFFGGEP